MHAAANQQALGCIGEPTFCLRLMVSKTSSDVDDLERPQLMLGLVATGIDLSSRQS